MDDYYVFLYDKISQYRRSFYPKTTAAKLIFFNLKYILSPAKSHPKFQRVSSGKLNIAVRVAGGLGDSLIAFNYIRALRNFLSGNEHHIDVYTHPKKMEMLKNFYEGNVLDETKLERTKGYDLVLLLLRVPQVVHMERRRIKKRVPLLWSLLNDYIEYERQNAIVFDSPGIGGQMVIRQALALGKTRIQEPDIGGRLGIGTDFSIEIPDVPDKQAVMTKFGLPDKIITLNRGVDEFNLSATSSKMWPLEHYNELIGLLQKNYPGYTLVQLGVSEERSPKMKDVNVNLVGRTSLRDLKGILRFSALHIDGEGGMVHLRQALKGGPSVVLFGPTSRELYGYSNNLNLRSNVCRWCEWQDEFWSSRCLLSKGEPLCMKALLPECVMEALTTHFPPD